MLKTERKNSYNTAHRDEIINILRSNPNRELTAKEIISMTKGNIGEATVYRTLKKLTDDGIIERDASAPGGASYRFCDDDCGCRFHLHCVNCGKIIHMDCDEMKVAESHIIAEHRFLPTDKATVIDGICSDCSVIGKKLKQDSNI